MSTHRFSIFAWGVLAYNLAVIAWGAYVRATGSGAGCGSHWPLCNGEIVPRAARIETLVEFSHRLSSGLAGILVLILLIWAWRAFPKGHLARLGAILSMLFMIVEALIGRYLVLFELVAENASIGRAIAISVHLANTFILLAFLALTAWWSGREETVQFRRNRIGGLFASGLVVMLVLGISGAVTALGDTLFPSTTLAEALQQDLSPTAHFLIRLRVLHPTIAVLVSAYLLFIVNWFQSNQWEPTTRNLGKTLSVLIVLQLIAGITNVLLLAPVWMQLLHLLISDAIWITLVLLTTSIFSQKEARVPEVPVAALSPSLDSK